MKIDMKVYGVSFKLIPENEEEKDFLKSWFANGLDGSIDIHYRSQNTKTGSIGLRLYKQEQTMLSAYPFEPRPREPKKADPSVKMGTLYEKPSAKEVPLNDR